MIFLINQVKFRILFFLIKVSAWILILHDPNQNIPAPVDVHGQLLPGDPGENQQRGQNPASRPQKYYKGYDNILNSDGTLVFPPLPQGHTFVVTSSLMEMLTNRGLLSGLLSEDPHAHIAKVKAMCREGWFWFGCNRAKGISSLTDGRGFFWFNKLPYNSIFTWNQLRNIFLARYYANTKKLNHKETVNNFVALPGELVCSSWDIFPSFLRIVPNHSIDDESLKEYFYLGQDDNNKEVLDTISGGSY